MLYHRNDLGLSITIITIIAIYSLAFVLRLTVDNETVWMAAGVAVGAVTWIAFRYAVFRVFCQSPSSRGFWHFAPWLLADVAGGPMFGSIGMILIMDNSPAVTCNILSAVFSQTWWLWVPPTSLALTGAILARVGTSRRHQAARGHD